MTKAALRAEMAARRQQQNAQAAAYASQEICIRLLPMLEGFKCVGGYIPMRGEVDISPLMHTLAVQGATLAVPYVIDKSTMEFRQYTAGAPPITDAMGLYSHAGVKVAPDCLIVPLLAFDGCGNRLGYGGGFYDRLIPQLRAQIPHFKAFGVAYQFQYTATLPVESHDACLDGVVSA